MEYRTVFEITQKGFEWWFSAAGLPFLLIGAFFVWFGRRRQWPQFQIAIGYFMAGFALLWSLAVFTSTYSAYHRCKKALETGRYLVVEGPVESFHAMPYEGHEEECFTVNQVTFCYSDYIVTPGFNTSASHGGPIREGLPVRVSYVGNDILRLEIRADSVPSEAELAAHAAAEEARWGERARLDPNLDRMGLGFSVAALFITLWWSLDWRRFMKFWIRGEWSQRLWVIRVFRVFFALCFLGSVYRLVQELLARDRPLRRYVEAGVAGLLWLGVFVLMVNLVEWLHRKHTAGREEKKTLT